VKSSGRAARKKARDAYTKNPTQERPDPPTFCYTVEFVANTNYPASLGETSLYPPLSVGTMVNQSGGGRDGGVRGERRGWRAPSEGGYGKAFHTCKGS
jgi:hypothetical protein